MDFKLSLTKNIISQLTLHVTNKISLVRHYSVYTVFLETESIV